MNETKKRELIAEKREFTENIGKLLATEPRSDVRYIEYDIEGDKEIVTVVFNGNDDTCHSMKILVTMNSCGAIFKEIARAVYGEGAVGEIYG